MIPPTALAAVARARTESPTVVRESIAEEAVGGEKMGRSGVVVERGSSLVCRERRRVKSE